MIAPRTRHLLKGLMLLELMLGFFLVTVAIFALFGAFPASQRAAVLADRTMQARQLAMNALQYELSQDYFNITTGSDSEEEPVQHTHRHGVDQETEFIITTEVTRPNPSKNIYKIAVSVSWKDSNSADAPEHKVVLESEKGALW